MKMVTEDDVVEVAVLREDLKHFILFARKNKIPIYKVKKNEAIDLAKSALNSPVLEKLTEGILNIYRDIPKDEYIDVDANDADEEGEFEEFDLPPDIEKEKGEDDGEKKEEK